MMGFILCDGGVVSNCLIAVKLLPTGGEMVTTTVRAAATTSDNGGN